MEAGVILDSFTNLLLCAALPDQSISQGFHYETWGISQSWLSLLSSCCGDFWWDVLDHTTETCAWSVGDFTIHGVSSCRRLIILKKDCLSVLLSFIAARTLLSFFSNVRIAFCTALNWKDALSPSQGISFVRNLGPPNIRFTIIHYNIFDVLSGSSSAYPKSTPPRNTIDALT